MNVPARRSVPRQKMRIPPWQTMPADACYWLSGPRPPRHQSHRWAPCALRPRRIPGWSPRWSERRDVTGSLSHKTVRPDIGLNGQKYITKPCKSSLIPEPKFEKRTQKIRDDRHGPTSWISITINEGKYRQIRKMTAAIGFPTLRLIRVRIGSILLGKLKLGEVKEVDVLF